MTTEQKARAYDEALERARKMLNMILDNELLGFPDQIREIFPQLCESEDERIRKEIIEYLKLVDKGEEDYAHSMVSGWIAWLERLNLSELNLMKEFNKGMQEALMWGREGYKVSPDGKVKSLTQEEMDFILEKQKDASKAIEAVDRIDKYIDEHLANAHDMKDSNPDKKYYRGWDDALGKMAGILQDIYSNEEQKLEQKKIDEYYRNLFANAIGRDASLYPIKGEQKEEEGYEAIPVESTLEYKLGFKAGKESEKQKEQKPSLCDECKKKSTCLDTKYGDDRVVEQCINFVKMKQKPAEVDESTKRLNDNWMKQYFDDYKERKPVEWSDTKELVFKDICNHLEVEGYSGWVLLLNALRNGEFQPKQEWSEEDELMMKAIIGILDENDHPKLCHWLKSLRPSWKPSEEQMEELNKVRTLNPGLDALYQQLKNM